MKSNVESSEYSNDPHERLNYLMAKHRELDDEADSMSRRVRLTPAEQYRLQDIKRARLKARDQIEILRTKLDRNMV